MLPVSKRPKREQQTTLTPNHTNEESGISTLQLNEESKVPTVVEFVFEIGRTTTDLSIPPTRFVRNLTARNMAKN